MHLEVHLLHAVPRVSRVRGCACPHDQLSHEWSHAVVRSVATHRAPTEITLIFCTEFYYHANISTNGNTRSLEKFLYEILYHPEFVQFDLDRKIMRHLLDPTIRTFDQSACRRGEFLCAGTRVRLYPNIKKILYFISSRAFWAYTILRVKSESLH
jgi:hypothetical protein